MRRPAHSVFGAARHSAQPPRRCVDRNLAPLYVPPSIFAAERPICEGKRMKIINSLKTAKLRDKNCRLVRRRGRIYVINKKNPRYKARQG